MMGLRMSDDSFACLLLTMTLSPDKEESERPLWNNEFHALCGILQSKGIRPGKLLGLDISGLMIRLGVDENTAYKLYVLLNRDVQVTYYLENLAGRGIYTVTRFHDEYPDQLISALGENAPSFFYMYGDITSLSLHHIGILAVSGIKTTPEERGMIETLCRDEELGDYSFLTGDEPGITRYAREILAERDDTSLCVLGGDMDSFVRTHPTSQAISLVHPSALFTPVHAAERNKFIFAMSDAAFIFNTFGKWGEAESITNRYCRSVYAWNGRKENNSLILRGAIPFSELTRDDLREMSSRWRSNDVRQLSIFDLPTE